MAFAEHPWQLLAEAGTASWIARKRELGPAEELRSAAALRALVVAQSPEWPAAVERTADLEVHARIGSSPRAFVNVLNDVAALILTRGADFLAAFPPPQLDALAYQPWLPQRQDQATIAA